MNRISFYFWLVGMWFYCPVLVVALDNTSKPTDNIWSVNFNLPRQSLPASLMEFSIQARMLVVVDYDLIKSKTAPALRGNYDAESGVAALLEGADLSFMINRSENSLIIIPQPTEPLVGGGEGAPKGTVEEVIVTGLQFPFRYGGATHSRVGNHLTVFESARFMSVLPKQFISDQNAIEVSEVLRLSSAISPSDGLADSNDDFYIRGFPRDALYLNGFRLDSKIGSKIQPSIIDGIEILKGPSTLRFGRGEPGGVVNLVTDQVGAKNVSEVITSIGSNNRHQAVLKVNTHLPTSATNARGKVIVAAAGVDQFRNISESRSRLVYPTLNFDTSSAGLFSLGYLNQSTSYEHTQGSIILAPNEQALSLVPTDLNPNLATLDFSSDLNIWQASFAQRMGEDWQLKASHSLLQEARSGVRGGRHIVSSPAVLLDKSDIRSDTETITLFDRPFSFDVGTIVANSDSRLYSVAKIRSLFDEQGISRSKFYSVNIDGMYVQGSVTHNLSFGGDFYDQYNFDSVFFEDRNDIKVITLNSSNLDTAVSEIVGTIALGEREPNQNNISERSQRLTYEEMGLYFQDTIELGARWVASAGARLSSTGGSVTDVSGNKDDFSAFDILTVQLGAVYSATDNASLYLNYCEGMKPNYYVDDFYGRVDLPEQSYQVELGAKWLGLNGRLMLTAALYSIEKSNSLELHFDSMQRQAVVGADQSVYGFDLDFTFHRYNIDVIGALSFMDTDTVDVEKLHLDLPNVAGVTGSVVGRYMVHSGWMSGASFSLGGHYLSDRFANTENTLVLDGYATVDVGISYGIKWFLGSVVQLNIKNIFNAQYVYSTDRGVQDSFGAGRSVQASFSQKF